MISPNHAQLVSASAFTPRMKPWNLPSDQVKDQHRAQVFEEKQGGLTPDLFKSCLKCTTSYPREWTIFYTSVKMALLWSVACILTCLLPTHVATPPPLLSSTTIAKTTRFGERLRERHFRGNSKQKTLPAPQVRRKKFGWIECSRFETIRW